jgi:hypothetical protein
MERGGPWVTIYFKTLILNKGNAFDLASGIFTAPITGLYHFDLLGQNDKKGWKYLAIVDSPTLKARAQTQTEGLYEAMTVSTNLVMKAGEKIVAAFGGQISDLSSPPYENNPTRAAQFSGYLVSPI